VGLPELNETSKVPPVVHGSDVGDSSDKHAGGKAGGTSKSPEVWGKVKAIAFGSNVVEPVPPVTVSVVGIGSFAMHEQKKLSAAANGILNCPPQFSWCIADVS
jgi:hypothetical protein